MAPFRPTNLNKRAYPGNANVIGPVTKPTCTPNTTTCDIFSQCIFGTQSAETFTLGCRCTSFTCPFCHCRCCCQCTVCTRTIPSGMWNISEQYEASSRDSWSSPSSSNTAPVGYCTPQCGTVARCANDCAAFFVCCGPSTNKFFVAPSCTERCLNIYCITPQLAHTCACLNCVGGTGWFIPNCTRLRTAGFECRSYWDSYKVGPEQYWSTDNIPPTTGNYCRGAINMSTGAFTAIPLNSPLWQRAFRCTAT